MEKYEPIGVVGEGSYGVVLKCRHRESGRSVAIKKFIDSEDDQNVRKIALREIRVLRKLRHENLVNLLEVFRRRKHLYLVFEFIDHTLLDELEARSNQGLEAETCRKYVYQILRGLGFCHDNNIIHRDVKPENILVSKNGIVKLCDFGFARNLCGAGEQLTDYVATRWYRAPELLVGDVAYGKEVDIWAVGCLFAEMMTGDPLFPGDSDIDQLFLIAQRLGRLSRRHLSLISRNSAFRGFQFPSPAKSRNGSTASTNSGGHSNKLAKLERKDTSEEKYSVFAELFPSWNTDAIHFLTHSLDPEPNKRPGCNALLRLPYFTWDNFPSRFINELNQKLQLEGRHPIPSYSTRKKRSVLGSLQGANNSHSTEQKGHKLNPTHNQSSHFSKKNPVHQARLNLAEEKIPEQPLPIPPQKSSFFQNRERDQTFLVEKIHNQQNQKVNETNRIHNGYNVPTRIPSLLARKYSDDNFLKISNGVTHTPGGSGASSSSLFKSTPNIVEEHKLSQNYSQPVSNGYGQGQGHSGPRKFSYSFPPPDETNNHSGINGNSNDAKIFQPLPVTTLTFTLGGHGQGQTIPQPRFKFPTSTFLSVTGAGTGIPGTNITGNANGTIKSPSNFNSSYFPQTSFGGISKTQQQIPAGVSIYQGPGQGKSLPVSVFGSSLMLKDHLTSVENGNSNGTTIGSGPFLPKVGQNANNKNHQQFNFPTKGKNGSGSKSGGGVSTVNGNGVHPSSDQQNQNQRHFSFSFGSQ